MKVCETCRQPEAKTAIMWPENCDHVEAWIDRLGNMVFIGDEMDNTLMNPAYYRAAMSDHDRNHGLTEAAVWWM